MDAKRLGKQVLGGVLTLIGCGLALALLRVLVFGHIENRWNSSALGQSLWSAFGLILLVALSVYIICSGLRMTNPRLVRPFRFGWGKILISLFVLSGRVGFYFHFFPQLADLKPSNPTEAASMKVAEIALGLFFSYLIFRGIRQGFTRPEPQLDTLPLQSPESGR
jgi:hypothetical protein